MGAPAIGERPMSHNEPAISAPAEQAAPSPPRRLWRAPEVIEAQLCQAEKTTFAAIERHASLSTQDSS